MDLEGIVATLTFLGNGLILNYNDILVASLTFIGTILAIFFTLIALPIQNILGRYSQELVENVKNDKHLRSYFKIFLGIFGYDFLLFAIPQNPILILFSLFLGLLSLILFYKLVSHVFYLLDVRNQIKDISQKIVKKMDSKFGNSFEIGDKNIEWLENETEILVDVIQLAIQENRFEIVDSGLKELVKIVKKYIILNKNNFKSPMGDKFLAYILNSLTNSKSLVTVHSHPKIMISIAKSASEMAKETLKIDTIGDKDYAYFLANFVNFLKGIILSFEMVKDTSEIPVIVSDELVYVGKTAIDLEYPRETEDIIQKLSEISKVAINIQSYRGDDISYRINWKIGYLLNYSIENLDKLGIYRTQILENMIKEIDKLFEYYLKDDYNHSFNSIKTLTGSIADYSISVIAHTLINKIKDKKFEINTYEKNLNYDGVDYLEDILNLLDHNIKVGINKNKYSYTLELIENTYTIGIGLINLILNVDCTESHVKSKKILESKVFLPLYDAMSESLEKGDTILFKSVPIYFSLIGITIFEDNDKILREIIEKHIKLVLNLSSEIKNSPRILYPYIRLIGSWIYKQNSNSGFLDEIKKIIEIQDDIMAEETRSKALYPVENGDKYPHMLIEQHIERPIFPYEYHEFQSINRELFDFENVEKFEKYLKIN